MEAPGRARVGAKRKYFLIYREREVVPAEVKVDVVEVGGTLHQYQLHLAGVIHALDLWAWCRGASESKGGGIVCKRHSSMLTTVFRRRSRRAYMVNMRAPCNAVTCCLI